MAIPGRSQRAEIRGDELVWRWRRLVQLPVPERVQGSNDFRILRRRLLRVRDGGSDRDERNERRHQ